MIFSMTGFAAQQREVGAGTLIIELRSVNHRYLELQLRIDENLRAFEPRLREAVAACLGRGKVECRLALHAKEGAVESEVSVHALACLATLSKAVLHHFPDSRPLSVAEVLRWPGVLAAEQVSAQALAADVAALLDEALVELTDSRAREGEKMKAHILDRASQMEALVEKVRPHLPILLQAYQEKLATRLREAMQVADDERIRQELAIFTQKIDVDEELSRLVAHLQEVRRVLAAGGSAGKRLDFLMQELNREANTLGAKSVATETSQVSMELKVLIEQMREQVQNIE
jgi:uncharacterized protein (TIGR00255 family)